MDQRAEEVEAAEGSQMAGLGEEDEVAMDVEDDSPTSCPQMAGAMEMAPTTKIIMEMNVLTTTKDF